MKKMTALLLAAIMVLSMAACGSAGNSDAESGSAAESAVAAESMEDISAGAEEVAGETGTDGTEESMAAEDAAEADASETAGPEEAAEEEGSTLEAEESQPAEESAAEDGTSAAEEGGEEGEEGTDGSAGDGKLTVAAASTLRGIMDDQFVPQFNERFPDITVEMIYDTSENLKNQIEAGAAYDVFFCGGKKTMSALQETGMVIEDSLHAIMTNELAFVVPRDSRLGIMSVADISKAASVVIGDPVFMPVGEYTLDALKEQELWAQIKEKDVYLATDVNEILTLLTDGTADCGFLYRNDAVADAGNIHVVEGFAPITYRICILAGTGRQETAQNFVDFMCSDSVLGQMAANGFTLPGQ